MFKKNFKTTKQSQIKARSNYYKLTLITNNINQLLIIIHKLTMKCV